MVTRYEAKKERLARLITERPELPVIPMVFSEVVAGYSCEWWQASLGDSSICKYVQVKDLEDAEGLEAVTDYMDEEAIIWYDEQEELKQIMMEETDVSEMEATRALAGLPWEKAIRVRIEMPDDAEFMKPEGLR